MPTKEDYYVAVRGIDISRFNGALLFLNEARKALRFTLDDWEIRRGRIDSDTVVKLPRGGWKRICVHDSWGGDRVDRIFRCKVVLPPRLRGKQLLFNINIGAEALMYINGKAVRGLTPLNPVVTIPAEAGRLNSFDIVLEAHSGWTSVRWAAPNSWLGGYVNFSAAEIFTVHEPVAELYYALLTLREEVTAGSHADTVVGKVIPLLKSVPWAELPDRKAMRQIPGLLRQLGKIRVPLRRKIDVCAHSHLDVGYYWPASEGIRKFARTALSVCTYVEACEDLTFTCPQAFLFDQIKKRYPLIYRKIKAAVRGGRFEPVGGTWVETDINCVLGESIVRQILYGKQFFEQEFGLESKVFWLPDCFGFGHALPQILRLSGYDWFVTAKLNFADPKLFPHNLFKWRGQDGTEINGMLLPYRYGGDLGPALVHEALERYAPPLRNDPMLLPYGLSDGGQGVSTEMMKKLPVMRTLYGRENLRPVVVEEGLRRFGRKKLPVWRDELYHGAHQGTYTTSARSKLLNRRAEIMMRDIEVLSVLSGTDTREAATSLWKRVLEQQFHDLLPGSCVPEAYGESMEAYGKVFQEGKKLQNKLLRGISGRAGSGVGLVNTLGWKRKDCAVIECDCEFVKTANGETLDCQRIGKGRMLILPKGLEAFSCLNVRFSKSGDALPVPFKAGVLLLETPFYKVRFRKGGVISSLACKRSGREVLAKPSNVFQLFVDEQNYAAAWDMAPDFEEAGRNLDVARDWRVEDVGALRVTYRSLRRFGSSWIKQRIHFYRDSPRIDFQTEVEWQEKANLLKVAFFPDVDSAFARFESPFGIVTRTLKPRTTWEKAKFEVPHLRFADISSRNFGVALMNDCKHGMDVRSKMLRLTLLRATNFPNPYVDHGRHHFSYALLPHPSSFARSEVAERALEFNNPILVAPRRASMSGPVTVLDGAAAIDTLKGAEDGNGMILRLYEPYMRSGVVTLRVRGVRSVHETDLLERGKKKISVKDGRFRLALRGGEIKTLRVLCDRRLLDR